jgi:2-C-methyl-D-erythritol 4-phosphate cytidylyltransferase/2-C-methyl-D-erythritol 2,4-cyclodiphosphate synthase
MHASAIIVAAGRGERAGGGVPKQFRAIGGKPMVRWSVEALQASPEIERIVVVTGAGDQAACAAALEGLGSYGIVPGAATRTGSVRAGLKALGGAVPDAVLIHDAARPGLTPAVVTRLCRTLDEVEACAPALAVADALKAAEADGRITADVPRAGLFRIQTPQAFRFAPLLAAFRALDEGAAFDDDIAIARAAGMQTRLVEGEARLMKVTTVADFMEVERMLGGGASLPCTGHGVDAHRFGPGDHVTLCGVRIAHDRGLVGHSDADAAWHALTDALLGAIASADIGEHFAPTDPRWRGASSEMFLRRAAELVAAAGGRIAHVDVTVICERPRMKPHREAMRARTADVLGLPLRRVSVKATTTEEMGFTGRGEGLAAQATATVLLPE